MSNRTELDWSKECQYISDVTGKRGHVKEMNYDRDTFARYCEMQRAAAEREGRHDSALYIQECLDDLRAFDRGPWKFALALANNAPNYYAVTNGKWGAPTIAQCFHEANARLVAAAPDLLEALESAVAYAADGTPLSARELDDMRAAIAKAKGAQ